MGLGVRADLKPISLQSRKLGNQVTGTFYSPEEQLGYLSHMPLKREHGQRTIVFSNLTSSKV